MRAFIFTGLSFCMGAGPALAAATPKPAPSRPAAVAKPAGLVIEHTALSCVVAERFVKLDACIKPGDTVARAQVQFRALPTSPWYAVDMKAEGPCLSAVLPKPNRAIQTIEYVIYAVDRGLTETYRPEGAPAKAFTPRVARAGGECASNGVSGWTPGQSSIEVTVARDAAGNAVSAAGAPQELSGFSSDGVALARNASASANAKMKAGGGGGVPVFLIVGGAAGAAGVGVVALSGNNSGPGGGGGGAGGGTPGSETDTPSGPGPLSGRWVGFRSEGGGHIGTQVNPNGDSCINYYDWQGTLTQTGNVLSGEMYSTFQGADCTLVDVPASAFPGADAGFFRAALTPPNGISIPWDVWVTIVGGAAGFGNYPLTGTYTNTTIVLTGQGPGSGAQWSTTLRLRRQ
jgi:hypothetical protein